MDNTRAVSPIHARLDQLAERMVQARTGIAAAHPEFEHDLATFIDRHDAIRSLIDETKAESAIATAEHATSDLERGLESWLQTVDQKYANPPPRNPSVSM